MSGYVKCYEPNELRYMNDDDPSCEIGVHVEDLEIFSQLLVWLHGYQSANNRFSESYAFESIMNDINKANTAHKNSKSLAKWFLVKVRVSDLVETGLLLQKIVSIARTQTAGRNSQCMHSKIYDLIRNAVNKFCNCLMSGDSCSIYIPIRAIFQQM